MTQEEYRAMWPDIVKLREQNNGYKTIANKLGISKDCVAWRCKQCGLTGTRGEITPKKNKVTKNKKAAIKARDECILLDNDAGLSWNDIAAKHGITKGAVRHVLTKYGRHIPHKETEEKRQTIIEMRLAGKSYYEITNTMGYTSVSSVQRVCQQAGLDKKWDFDQKAIAIREDRSKGMTLNELAEKYAVSTATVEKACKGMPELANITALRHRGIKAATQKQHETATNKYYEFLTLHGFTDPIRDGNRYTARCRNCGSVIELSQTTLKHYERGTLGGGDLQCKNCMLLASKKKCLEDDLKAKFRKIDKQLKISIKEKIKQERNKEHPCLICGRPVIGGRKKYCSDTCRKKASSRQKENRRRNIIKPVLIDKDISLERLYERDGGRCHICGEHCDWDDYKRIDGYFTVGPSYPSVDHVVPLAKGGEHSWANVKLAHHYCNTLKSDKLPA